MIDWKYCVQIRFQVHSDISNASIANNIICPFSSSLKKEKEKEKKRTMCPFKLLNMNNIN